jgi:hypothetical protein
VVTYSSVLHEFLKNRDMGLQILATIIQVKVFHEILARGIWRMPPWLTTTLSSSEDLTVSGLARMSGRIVAAMILGGVVVGIYRWAKRGEFVPPTFATTLVLLAGLIAMATQVIGDNIARAFALVGALSVVRFRTVVKDTQDTAFVILAVVVGMSAGASHLAVGIVGLILMAIAAPFLWPPGRVAGWDRDPGILRLTVEGNPIARLAVETVFQSAFVQNRLISAATAKKGASLELAYSVRLRPGGSPIEVVGELNRIEGVSGVELAKE